jgi:hypothetical protein
MLDQNSKTVHKTYIAYQSFRRYLPRIQSIIGQRSLSHNSRISHTPHLTNQNIFSTVQKSTHLFLCFEKKYTNLFAVRIDSDSQRIFSPISFELSTWSCTWYETITGIPTFSCSKPNGVVLRIVRTVLNVMCQKKEWVVKLNEEESTQRQTRDHTQMKYIPLFPHHQHF